MDTTADKFTIILLGVGSGRGALQKPQESTTAVHKIPSTTAHGNNTTTPTVSDDHNTYLRSAKYWG